MAVYRADWVLPIAAAPIRDGWVAVEAGRIAASGSGPAPAGVEAALPCERGAFAILPALTNAHTHLELSYMRGQVPPGTSFDAWVRALIALRSKYPDPLAGDIIQAIRHAIGEARAAGTGVIGDIGNTLVSARMLHDAGMPAHVFHEVLGFRVADGTQTLAAARRRIDAVREIEPGVRISLAPHAPYSVSPALFRSIAGEMQDAITSIHLGESPEEVHFLLHGGGPIQTALESLGAWNPDWTPPRCGPVEYIEKFGLLSERLLAVHGVHLSYRELAQLASAGATLVTCPRSNRWVGAGNPPAGQFYASGVRVAIGTDSLASVEDLNLFSEMAQIRALGPDIPARAIVESATRIGAEALGFGEDYGTIEPGKRAALIAVRVPDGVDDVEEYLVSGIRPADVAWLYEPWPTRESRAPCPVPRRR
jgi:cytosine/adenosine deaminase-related metal-dependent hydrolase